MEPAAVEWLAEEVAEPEQTAEAVLLELAQQLLWLELVQGAAGAAEELLVRAAAAEPVSGA